MNNAGDSLFLNIVSPPSFPAKKDFPVKVYIHGGYATFSCLPRSYY